MRKQTFSKIKKTVAVLLAVFCVVTLTVALASACGSNGHASSVQHVHSGHNCIGHSCHSHGHSNNHSCKDFGCKDKNKGCFGGCTDKKSDC